MYDVLVGFHDGRERPFDNVGAYVVSADTTELILTGGSWQEVRVTLNAVAYWTVRPAGT